MWGGVRIRGEVAAALFLTLTIRVMLEKVYEERLGTEDRSGDYFEDWFSIERKSIKA